MSQSIPPSQMPPSQTSTMIAGDPRASYPDFASPGARTRSRVLVAAAAVLAAGAIGFVSPHLAVGAPAAVEKAPLGSFSLSVSARQPGAKMLFRGNTVTLPYTAQVDGSEAPESIEVVAPGAEGRRYWVKLDRTRTLAVNLPSGTGVLEANYDETRAALGDAVAESAQAVATPAPLAVASAAPADGGRPPKAGARTWRGARSPQAAVDSPVGVLPAVAPPSEPPKPPPATSKRPQLDQGDPWEPKGGGH